MKTYNNRHTCIFHERNNLLAESYMEVIIPTEQVMVASLDLSYMTSAHQAWGIASSTIEVLSRMRLP